MSNNDVIAGYLDVKISSKSRRGLTPWKAWQRQWCEIKRLEDNISNGLELTLKSSLDGGTLNSLVLPRSATICRTESRTKQYAFGVFTQGRNQKPLLFLSGVSESDSQEWMASIRRMLCVASYLPVGNCNFHVSLVDNAHSRASGLVGLYGVLGVNNQEIVVSDPCTGAPKITWNWHQFHQFHLQASAHSSDEKMICVMHTSSDFPTGPGHLHFYCKRAPRLLQYLISRGKSINKCDPALIASKRLSRSEGDLCVNVANRDSKTGPICFGSYNGSDDSGVRTSVGSDDSGGCSLKGKAISTSLFSLGMGVLTKTPGGSETNGDSIQDLSQASNVTEQTLPRPESGVSLASGIYEEISDTPSEKPKKSDLNSHIYENLDDVVIQKIKLQIKPDPPPLPRRNLESGENGFRTLRPKMANRILSPYKQRCNTLPAKDLTRISQIFTSESQYVVMTPTKSTKSKSTASEGVYMPMTSPIVDIKTKLETCYMVMNGKKT